MNNRFVVWGLAFSVGLNLVLITMVSYHLSQGLWPAPPARVAARSPMTHTLTFRETDMTQLNLTPPQRRQFRRINQQWFIAEQKDKTQGEERIALMSTLLMQDDLSTTTLKPVYTEIRRHSDDFFVRLTSLIQDYRAVLTPRQRLLFNTMLQGRFEVLRQYARSKNLEYEKLITETIRREQQKDLKTPVTVPLEKKGKGRGRGPRAGLPPVSTPLPTAQ